MWVRHGIRCFKSPSLLGGGVNRIVVKCVLVDGLGGGCLGPLLDPE